MSNPSTRFTGIFIPAEVLEIQDLTLFEMILLSWIDALYCPSHGGCFASNEYLGSKIRNAEENTVAKALTKLRKMELIEDVSFDGRTRVIRALIHRYVDKAQSKAALDINPIGVGQKSNPTLDRNPSRVPPILIYDSKEENKDKNIAQTAAPPRQKRPIVFRFCFEKNEFEGIEDSDIERWKELFPSLDIKKEIKRSREWILANPSRARSKRLWRKFILGWFQRANEKLTNSMAYQSQKSQQVLSRHIGFQQDNRPRDPSKTIDLSQ